MNQNWLRSVIFILATSAGVSQPVSMSPAASGFVFDPTQGSLRQIAGVPGGSTFSSPLSPPVASAWPSPNLDSAIAIQDGRTVLMRRLRSEPEVSEEGILPHPTTVAWSRTGAAAAIYSASSDSLQCLENDRAFPPIPLRSLDGEVAALTVHDCRRVVISKGSGVYLIQEGGTSLPVLRSAATALAASRDRVFIATKEEIVVYDPETGSTRSLAGLPGVSHLALSKRGDLVALNQTDRMLAVLSPAGDVLLKLSLERRPSGLQSLNGSIFLLNGLDEERQPAIVLDTTAEPALFFIPAPPSGSL